MPVSTMAATHPLVSTSTASHITGGLSIRQFHIPRLKTAATAFRRHVHNHLNDAKQHNRLVAACTLPEDVLRKIFISCAQIGVLDFEDHSWSWVNISYVCARWRKTALDCKEFWRYIDFSHPRWHAITLTRAKMSSMHIATAVTESNIRLLQRTLQLAHRIQHIHLKSSTENIRPLLEILAHPNPASESLIVDVDIPEGSAPLSGFDPPSFPTTGVLGPPLRNLKYLELHNTPFYLLTSRCIYLTHLHLHNLPISERPTLRHFLFMLEHLRHLKFLTLDQAFPINIDSNNIKALERPVSFPRLELISLIGSVLEIANILQCLIIPPSTQLIAKICTLSGAKDHVQKLAAALNDHSRQEGEHSMFETLVISGTETGSRYADGFVPAPGFRQSLRIRAFKAEYAQDGPTIDLTICPEEHDCSDDGIITVLSAIWEGLSFTHTHTLALQDVNIITQKTWSRFLRGLPSLRILDITGRAPSGLVWALLLNARSQLGDEEAWLFVPKLNDVYLHNVDCSSGGYMVASRAAVNSYSDLDDSRFLDVLVASLNSRQTFGLAVRSLSIARCDYVLRSTVANAREAVSHLICDFGRLAKDEDVDTSFPARYSIACDFTSPKIRHYHRLRTLLQLDSLA